MNWDLTASVQTWKQMFNRMSGENSMETMPTCSQKTHILISMIYTDWVQMKSLGHDGKRLSYDQSSSKLQERWTSRYIEKLFKGIWDSYWSW